MTAELRQAVANYAHALDELNVPEPEAVMTEDTTWTFTIPGQGVLGPVAGRAAVLDFIRLRAGELELSALRRVERMGT
ncbi:nuclear transport factor 2 family protein [Streptomyces sp. NBC_00320]|uniref:nuclear transport factor 2 family protein n=2 Tax=unclassified Streptomyces TaxID=2593676 RepID=UPI00225BCF54|nr:nuclear transport factor 2 family protein [Streptomyces sp. NBC_00320]MCX5151696.1 nuclear transport factor 2 family protein [Streptomyces sp. NBC_00320]